VDRHLDEGMASDETIGFNQLFRMIEGILILISTSAAPIQNASYKSQIYCIYICFACKNIYDVSILKWGCEGRKLSLVITTLLLANAKFKLECRSTSYR